MSERKLYHSFKISSLIALKQKAELSEEEQDYLDNWLNESKANRELYEQILHTDHRDADLKDMMAFNSAVALAKVSERMRQDKLAISSKTYRLWPRIAVAAASVVAIVFGVWFFNGKSGFLKQVQDEVAYKNDVAAGKNTATLTLANGKTIQLSEAKTGVVIDVSSLKYSDGSLVQDAGRNEGSATLTAATPRGGTYQVILPDGTKVWLNAASSLKFPKTFAGASQRKVILNGEAYFEVTKDKKHPFKVMSGMQEIEVLGTHFNVNAYTDEESIKTTLLEGSVMVGKIGVMDKGDPWSSPWPPVVLKPNEQSILSSENKIKVVSANVEDVVAWKNGYFRFNALPLETIMRQLARWYDIEVVYLGAVPTDTFDGVIDRKANLSRILKILEKGGVHFKLESKKITVIP